MGGERGWNLRSERMDGEKMGELEERGGMGGEEGEKGDLEERGRDGRRERGELEDQEEGRGEEVGSRGREVRM